MKTCSLSYILKICVYPVLHLSILPMLEATFVEAKTPISAVRQLEEAPAVSLVPVLARPTVHVILQDVSRQCRSILAIY